MCVGVALVERQREEPRRSAARILLRQVRPCQEPPTVVEAVVENCFEFKGRRTVVSRKRCGCVEAKNSDPSQLSKFSKGRG